MGDFLKQLERLFCKIIKQSRLKARFDENFGKRLKTGLLFCEFLRIGVFDQSFEITKRYRYRSLSACKEGIYVVMNKVQLTSPTTLAIASDGTIMRVCLGQGLKPIR